MGLDWNPGNRPKPGHEAEFHKLFKKLAFGNPWRRDKLVARFHEISISAFDTLNAPTVRVDDNATQWAREAYARQKPDMTEEEWLRQMSGYRVLVLVPPCDGLPRYTHGPLGYVELFSFRGQFLVGCEEIIGEDMVTEGWESKTTEEMLDYGQRLKRAAEAYAESHDIDTNSLDTENMEGIEPKIDIVLSAGRWCLFWAERGHVLEAFF